MKQFRGADFMEHIGGSHIHQMLLWFGFFYLIEFLQMNVKFPLRTLLNIQRISRFSLHLAIL